MHIHMDLHAIYRSQTIESHPPHHIPMWSGRSRAHLVTQLLSRPPARSLARSFAHVHHPETPLNLSWNQFINYHIIKFKYKYYMVLYYVFGIAVNSTAYCIIHLAVHSLISSSVAMHIVCVRACVCDASELYQRNNILNGKLCGLLSMNHENDQLKIIWISLGTDTNSLALYCATRHIRTHTYYRLIRCHTTLSI